MPLAQQYTFTYRLDEEMDDGSYELAQFGSSMDQIFQIRTTSSGCAMEPEESLSGEFWEIKTTGERLYLPSTSSAVLIWEVIKPQKFRFTNPLQITRGC